MDRKVQIVTSAYIQDCQKFLIVKRADNERFLPKMWELPGGKAEVDENPNASVIREISEECGLDIVIERPAVVQTYVSEEKNIQYVEIFYLAKKNLSQNVILSNEHSAFEWVTIEDLSKYKNEMTEYCIDTIQKIHSQF